MHSPFDIMAETYDSDFTHTAIGRLQRKQVWESIRPVLNSYQEALKILEINCGTGEDALELSRSGHQVIATDASEAMIEKARQKASLLGETAVTFHVCAFDQLKDRFAGEQFDLVISNFGGLNCIDQKQLEKLSTQLFGLLTEHGRLFFVIMGSSCLWEILYYLFKLRPAAAFRRKRNAVSFQSAGGAIPVFYHSPRNLRKIFNPLYRYCSSKPVGLFIPPSYLEKQFQKRQKWLRNLSRLEKKFSRYPALSNLADHYCIIFQKKGSL